MSIYCNNCSLTINSSERWCIFKKDKPENLVCDNHTIKCDECEETAEYKYNGINYCKDCLFNELEITTETVETYYRDGEYLGTEEEMSSVIDGLSEDIEEINIRTR